MNVIIEKAIIEAEQVGKTVTGRISGRGIEMSNIKEITLLASAPTLEKITNLITEFYAGSTITLDEISKDQWSISTGKGLCKGIWVTKNKAGRYRFIMVSE